MSDDGMLLNFNIGDGILAVPTKYKGGTWRDRLSVKRIASRRKQTREGLPLSQDRRVHRPSDDDNRRPPKRSRVEPSDFRPALHASSTTASSQEVREHRATRVSKSKPREIISSLFTYNPSATTADESSAQGPIAPEASRPSNAPLPDGIDTFTSLGLSQSLATYLLTKLELRTPTAIQKKSISQLTGEDCDAFIQAQTGSGKTLAYLLPIVQRLMNISVESEVKSVQRHSGLFAIILAPTRELCKQISAVLEALLRCAHNIVVGTVIGGEKKKSEKARLRKGLNILVATPGRLADHLDNTTALDVGLVRWLVLDEADRLMDLGFEKEIEGIVKKLGERVKPAGISGLPQRRVTVLCSATLTMNVQRLGDISLKDASHIQAHADEGDEAEKSKEIFLAPAQLKQSYAIVAAKLRLVSLTALLKRMFARKGSVMKAIIFVSCADSVDFHYEVFTRSKKHTTRPTDTNSDTEQVQEPKLETIDVTTSNKKGARNSTLLLNTVSAATAFSNPTSSVMLHKLHGSLPQHVRTATLNAFAKQKDAAVLICTDVGARGLDLPNIDYVIEYDPAYSAEDHLHRIGRTARLGRDGKAIVFLLPGPEEAYAEVLKSGFREKEGRVVRVDVNDTLKLGFGGSGSSGNWEEKATDWQLNVERWALDNPHVLELARKAYQSHIRAYATHMADERKYFNVKDLHLGHLAKSFALRDRPAKINVPGLRPTDEATKKDFRARRKGGTSAGGDESKKRISAATDTPTDANAAAQRMKAKLSSLMGSGASEFNLA